MVDQVPHELVLDVGPGHGKYAVLMREYLRVPPATIDAVEAWPAYVLDHDLEALYGQVYVDDVADLTSEILEWYDLVLMVDVLEHLDIDDGVRVLDRIAGRVVICTPVGWIQNPEGETIPPELHRSLWTEPDFAAVAALGGRELEVCYQNLGGWLVRFGPKR